MRMCSEYRHWKLSWKAAACNIHKYLLHVAFSFSIRLGVMEGGADPVAHALKDQKFRWSSEKRHADFNTRSHNLPLKTKLKTFRTQHRKEIKSEMNEQLQTFHLRTKCTSQLKKKHTPKKGTIRTRSRCVFSISLMRDSWAIQARDGGAIKN